MGAGDEPEPLGSVDFVFEDPEASGVEPNEKDAVGLVAGAAVAVPVLAPNEKELPGLDGSASFFSVGVAD